MMYLCEIVSLKEETKYFKIKAKMFFFSNIVIGRGNAFSI